jgi:hypothetical protein
VPIVVFLNGKHDGLFFPQIGQKTYIPDVFILYGWAGVRPRARTFTGDLKIGFLFRGK